MIGCGSKKERMRDNIRLVGGCGVGNVLIWMRRSRGRSRGREKRGGDGDFCFVLFRYFKLSHCTSVNWHHFVPLGFVECFEIVDNFREKLKRGEGGGREGEGCEGEREV